MERKNILFPFEVGKDNIKAFAFTLEMAKKINANIITLSVYDLSHRYLLSAKAYHRAVERKKEKLHLNLLELQGIYQAKFSQWDYKDVIKIKSVTREGKMGNAISWLLKKLDDTLLLLNPFSALDFPGCLQFELLSRKFKILILSESEVTSRKEDYLNKEEIEIGKNSILEQMLLDSKIYNLPDDKNYFQQVYSKHSL